MFFLGSLKNLPLDDNASVCLVSARRYGDAIIHAHILRAAAKSRPDIQWTIWTKPEFAPLFRLMGFTQIVTSEFPIAGGAPKLFRECGASLIHAINKLRKCKFDASIDFIGDSRESFLGMLLTGLRHFSPRWTKLHWMHRVIWNTPIPLVNYITISENVQGVYHFIPLLIENLIGKKIFLESKKSMISQPPKIAFHPFSSAQFRYWPAQNWTKLGNNLIKEGYSPVIICSDKERPEALRLFHKDSNSLPIISCPSIKHLIDEINTVDILVGLDSFLIHLAFALGKKTIAITAGHLPDWWKPPEGYAHGESGGCKFYPCANVPQCINSTFESSCIKSVSEKFVMQSIQTILNKNIQ